MAQPLFDADVLVVGAGPVGMALAIELGQRSSRVLLIERDSSRGPQPRAKTLNMRSLEHFRRWGIADAVRAASPTSNTVPTDIVFRTRMYGQYIATLPNIYFRGNKCASDPRFNEPSEWIPQYLVEGVMKAHLDGITPVEQCYSREFVDAVQDSGGVNVTMRDAGGEIVKARVKYVVGADGARSAVREHLGIGMTGRYAYSANYNMVLRIPELNRNAPEPPGIMHWLINEDSPGVMGPIGEFWYLAHKLPDGVSTMSEKEIRDLVNATVGREVDFELITSDPWYAHELIADSYTSGRIFLVGDACHLHPPFGGYGMNMGIGDAVDLGWKLNAVLCGWAGEAMLKSYEFERRRVHRWTIDESVANYALLSRDLLRPDLEADTPEGEESRRALAPVVIEQKRREFHTIGLVLGYHYSGSPIVADGEVLPTPSAEEYSPRALPGTLAPHFWLEPGVSLYDRFGPGLTLLTRSASRDSVKAFKSTARLLQIPLAHLELPAHVESLYSFPMTLVRPDEHVAWVGETVNVEQAESTLRRVSAREVQAGADII